MFAKSIVTALLASTVAAADKNETCYDQLNVSSQSDLDSISQCEVFHNDIHVSGDAGVLTLNGVQNITGDLRIFNATHLTSFAAPSLKKVDGTLDLEILTKLNTLAMPQLTDLGAIKFVTLPDLEGLQFNSGVENCRNILISDTSLHSLDGLDLSNVENFDVNNNKNIQDITIGATSISQLLDISFNAEKVNVSLPNLKWANNATFQYCASVYMPNLTYVNESLGFINNTLYNISVNNLEKIGGSLAISSNPHLVNASFESLTSIGGGFIIANNTLLNNVTGFDKLESVDGAIDFEGNFTSAELPKLDEVAGGVYVDSDNYLNCSSFDEAHSRGDFHGDKYVCKGKETSTSASLSPATTTKGSSSSDEDSKTARATSSTTKSSSSKSKNGANVKTASTGLLGVFAAFIYNLL